MTKKKGGKGRGKGGRGKEERKPAGQEENLSGEGDSFHPAGAIRRGVWLNWMIHWKAFKSTEPGCGNVGQVGK